MLGDNDGEADGNAVGLVVGDPVGAVDGTAVGSALGRALGVDDGDTEGASLGLTLGANDGASVLSQQLKNVLPSAAGQQATPAGKPLAEHRE